ncbi:hypothetical protein LTS14_003517 [Recurvomyces mirabilis]|uniref:uncharacterized protein n=1 Tax=Recurvomyces mirabilis TaxID=574656 RepID=UPI002DE10E6A|nr:hypothetical protein LTS14_003517 [Recurvomyces mirabilis]
MTNGRFHGGPVGAPPGIMNGVSNGLNGVSNGQHHGAGSPGNSSSGGGSSISPAPSTNMHEPKMLGNAQFQDAQFANAHARQQRRRTTIGERSINGMSAPAVLEEEQVATRWNPNGVDAPFEHRSSRRNSYVPQFSNSPRAGSPDMYGRGLSPVSAMRSPLRNGHMNGGAMSPVSTLRNDGIIHRSQSPLSHEVISTNVSRNQSPAQGVGNIARNGNAFLQQQQQQQQQASTRASQEHQVALAALQGTTAAATPPPPATSTPSPGPLPPLGPAPLTTTTKTSTAQKLKHRLSLQTHQPPSTAHPPPAVPEEDEMEEIITMSPAVRSFEPVVSYRKSRSSLALSAMGGVGKNASQVSLSGNSLSGRSLTASAGERKRYFGQMVEAGDLVASGIENAFERL